MGCASVGKSALPSLEQYGDDVWSLAADELDALPDPCPAMEVVEGCSAAATFLIDYDRLYRQIEGVE